MAPSIVKPPAGKTRDMSEHPREPGEQIERSADQLEEDLGRVEDHIDEAKGQLEDQSEDDEDATAGPREPE
jgi:hypothetical protein